MNIVQTIKSLLKRIFGIICLPLYNKSTSILRRILAIDELTRLSHHLILQNKELESKLIKIEGQIFVNSFLLTGVGYYDNFGELNNEISLKQADEIVKLAKNNLNDNLSALDYFKIIDKNSFQKKSVVVLFGNNPFFINILLKLNVKKILLMDFSPYSPKLTQIDGEIIKSIFVYPMNVNKVFLELNDVLLSPNEHFSSLMIKNDLFNLGLKTKEVLIMTINTITDSVYTDQIDPKAEIDTNGNIAYNDNYIRFQLHSFGFYEVNCLYTYGEHIDNYFDKKVSHFRYKNGYKIIKKNSNINLTFRKKQSTINNSSLKIYIARKLPSKNNVVTY